MIACPFLKFSVSLVAILIIYLRDHAKGGDLLDKTNDAYYFEAFAATNERVIRYSSLLSGVSLMNFPSGTI